MLNSICHYRLPFLAVYKIVITKRILFTKCKRIYNQIFMYASNRRMAIIIGKQQSSDNDNYVNNKVDRKKTIWSILVLKSQRFCLRTIIERLIRHRKKIDTFFSGKWRSSMLRRKVLINKQRCLYCFLACSIKLWT